MSIFSNTVAAQQQVHLILGQAKASVQLFGHMLVELLCFLHHQWFHLGLGGQSSSHPHKGSTLRRRTKETNRLGSIGHVCSHLAGIHIFRSPCHLGEHIWAFSQVITHHRLECFRHTNGLFVTQHPRFQHHGVGHHLADALLGQLLTGIHHQAGMELQLGVHVAAHIRLTVCTFTEHHTLHEVEHCTHCRLELLQASDLAQLRVGQHVGHEFIHGSNTPLRGSLTPAVHHGYVVWDLRSTSDLTHQTGYLLVCLGAEMVVLLGRSCHELQQHALHFQCRLTQSTAPLSELTVLHG